VLAPLAVNVVATPEQVMVVPLTPRVGRGFTVKENTALLEQVPEEPITLYVLLVVGEGVIVLVVEPSSHR
jgi:hypothetical protein